MFPQGKPGRNKSSPTAGVALKRCQRPVRSLFTSPRKCLFSPKFTPLPSHATPNEISLATNSQNTSYQVWPTLLQQNTNDTNTINSVQQFSASRIINLNELSQLPYRLKVFSRQNVDLNQLCKVLLEPNIVQRQQIVAKRCLRKLNYKIGPMHLFLRKLRSTFGTSTLLVVCLECSLPLKSSKCVNSYCKFFDKVIKPSYQARIMMLDAPKQIAVALYLEGRLTDNLEVTVDVSTDGAPLVQKGSASIWPVMYTIRNLKFHVRFRQRNVIVGALWQCRKKPPSSAHWQLFLGASLRQLANQTYTVILPNMTQRTVSFKIGVFTADLPAVCSVCNKSSYNAKVGACSFCLVSGIRHGGTQIYPWRKAIRLRTFQNWLASADEAEKTKTRVNGIIGLSVLLEFMRLPDQLVIDYFHGVLHGMFGSMFSRWQYISIIPTSLQHSLNDAISKLKLPKDLSGCDLNAFNHSDWKAKHEKIFGLYVGPLLLYSILPDRYYFHYLLLVVSIRLLSTQVPSIERRKSIASTISLAIEIFQKLLPKIYDKKSETMNAHNLQHLPSIFLEYDSISNYSAFAFEGKVGQLVSLSNGTQYQIETMTSQIYKDLTFELTFHEENGTREIGRGRRRPLKTIPQHLKRYVQQTFPNSKAIFYSSSKASCGMVYARMKGGGTASKSASHLVRTLDNKVIDAEVIVNIDDIDYIIGYEFDVVSSEILVTFLENGLKCRDLHARKIAKFCTSMLTDCPSSYDFFSSILEIASTKNLNHCSLTDIETKLIVAERNGSFFAITWTKQDELH